MLSTTIVCALHSNRQWELASPSSDLLLQISNLLDPATTGNLSLEVLLLIRLFRQLVLNLLSQLDALINVPNNALEILLAHATARHGRSTDTNTLRRERRLITRSSVLVASDVDLLQHSLDSGTIEADWLEVEEDHVVVCALCDELVAALLEGLLELLGVLDDLFLILLELWRLSLLQRDGEGSNGVVVWSTLVAWEDGEIDGAFEVVVGHHLFTGLRLGLANAFAEEDHRSTRTAERFVSGGRDNVGVVEWRVVDLCSDETADVRHVDHEVAANFVCDLAHALVVDRSAVRACACYESLGPVHQCIFLELVVVDDASIQIYAVREGLKVCRHCTDLLGWSLVAVAQMTAVRKVEAHQSIVRTHDRLVHLEIGGRTREWLDVDPPSLRIEMERFECSLLAKQFDLVDVLVATVVSGTGVPLAVLVAHWRAQGIEYRS